MDVYDMFAGLSFIDPASAVPFRERTRVVQPNPEKTEFELLNQRLPDLAVLFAGGTRVVPPIGEKTEFELLNQRLTTCGQSDKEVLHVNASCRTCESVMS